MLELRGGRKPREEVMVEVSGPVGVDDLEELLAQPSPSVPEGHRGIANIRYAHHQLAMLLAEGREQNDVALMTGYSPAYISVIKEDPTFRELLAYYEAQKREVFVDVVERRKTLGLMALEELQKRVTEEPEKFTARELMELHREVVGQASSGEAASGKAPSISISFHSPAAQALPPSSPLLPGIVIEGEKE